MKIESKKTDCGWRVTLVPETIAEGFELGWLVRTDTECFFTEGERVVLFARKPQEGKKRGRPKGS